MAIYTAKIIKPIENDPLGRVVILLTCPACKGEYPKQTSYPHGQKLDIEECQICGVLFRPRIF